MPVWPLSLAFWRLLRPFFCFSPAVHRRAQFCLFRYPRQLEKALGTGSKQAPRTNSKHKIPRRHFFPSPFFPHPLCSRPSPPETYIRCQIKPLFCTIKFGAQLLTPPPVCGCNVGFRVGWRLQRRVWGLVGGYNVGFRVGWRWAALKIVFRKLKSLTRSGLVKPVRVKRTGLTLNRTV